MHPSFGSNCDVAVLGIFFIQKSPPMITMLGYLASSSTRDGGESEETIHAMPDVSVYTRYINFPTVLSGVDFLVGP